MLTAELISFCPAQLRVSLARYLAGAVSGEITLMHFALALGDTGLLGTLVESLAGAAPERKELADLARLAASNMDHLAQVTALGNCGLVSIPSGCGDQVAAIRQQFDRAVALAPEASVALYSLGSTDILDRATNEIVSRLAEWRLLRSDFSVLDIGCGIGRIERALAPQVGKITAIDVSLGMIEEARRRCRDLANVAFAHCGGRDLAAYRDRFFDLILAVDSFPYLFAADPEIVAQHLRDCAWVLRPGGAAAILNFSYRGDDEADRQDVERLAAICGFTVERAGTRDFKLWDGLTFLLTLPARRG
jgi:SAM-dependent methyltransferase